jgi:hypothetical protein
MGREFRQGATGPFSCQLSTMPSSVTQPCRGVILALTSALHLVYKKPSTAGQETLLIESREIEKGHPVQNVQPISVRISSLLIVMGRLFF